MCSAHETPLNEIARELIMKFGADSPSARVLASSDLPAKKEYNQVRPHSSLDYRPPAPEVRIPVTLT